MLRSSCKQLLSTWKAMIGAGLLLATPYAQALQEFNFKVLLDDREIGFHRFQVTRQDDRQTVDIEADFKVTFFAIPFYRYGHSNQEVWQSGCLESIQSTTNDNGDSFSVDGRRDQAGFSISTQSDAFNLNGSCVMTFAYWNMEMLEQSALLNAQTGEYLPVEIEFSGEEVLKFDDQSVSASRYRLRNSDQELDISIWYETGTGRWLSLESRVADDRIIRYLPVSEQTVAATDSFPVSERALNAVR